MDSSNNTMDIPLLRGWFLKEKKETFKRRGSIISRSGTNRRWFTIENIVSSSTNKNSELALCYYKRSSDQESSGWMFLNDVLSITQDAGTRWITIEHPSRILRIQSPTPAQHRVWFSALSKSCSNVQKDITLSSSSGHDKRPNLPWLMNPSVRRTSADHVISTPKDELKFLREITGQVDSTNEKENEPKNLLRDIDDSPISLKASCPIIHSFIDQDVVEGKIHSLLETVDHPNIKQTTNRIHQSIKHSTQSGVKNNVEPYNVCSSSHESIDSTSDDGISVPREAPAKKQILFNLVSQNRDNSKDDFNFGSIQNSLNQQEHNSSDSIEDVNNRLNVPNKLLKKYDIQPCATSLISKSQSLTSRDIGYSRSSSYQRHFDCDDLVLKPDDNFLDNWDE